MRFLLQALGTDVKTHSDKINEKGDFKFIHLLNGTLEEKLGTLTQIKLQRLVRIKDIKNPVIQSVISL